MTKTTTQAVTACPDCDSGNLHTSGSEVECLSCGWKHKAVAPAAKRARTTKVPSKAPASAVAAQTAPRAAPSLPSVAEQLAAAVTVTKPTKAAKAAKPADTTKFVAGKAFRPRTNQLATKGAEGKGNFAQAHNWEVVAALLSAGPATRAELEAALIAAAKAGGYEATCNARGFVQGRVRNGHLVAAQ
jgi:hypothetical protein